MQELTFEQVEEVSGGLIGSGTGGSGSAISPWILDSLFALNQQEGRGGVDWGHIAEGAATGALMAGTAGLRNCAPYIGTGGAGYALCVGGHAVGGAVTGAAGAGLWQGIKSFFSGK